MVTLALLINLAIVAWLKLRNFSYENHDIKMIQKIGFLLFFQ